jgi:hypothetical protein
VDVSKKHLVHFLEENTEKDRHGVLRQMNSNVKDGRQTLDATKRAIIHYSRMRQ